VLARPDTIIFFILQKKYIHIYNLYSILKLLSMMFYWLDSFTQYLIPFFHQGMSSNPTSALFLIFYADLINGPTG
jgi:hypothetical protein